VGDWKLGDEEEMPERAAPSDAEHAKSDTDATAQDKRLAQPQWLRNIAETPYRACGRALPQFDGCLIQQRA
jgi:hypothetical protein